MSRFFDVEGFDEATRSYENRHPEDNQLVCEYCDNEGCPECDPEEQEDE